MLLARLVTHYWGNAAFLEDGELIYNAGRLAGIPGVGRIDVQGSEIRQIEVIADPSRLATAGLTYVDLATAVEKALGVRVVIDPGCMPQYAVGSASALAGGGLVKACMWRPTPSMTCSMTGTPEG